MRKLLYRNFRQIYAVSNWFSNRMTPMGGLIFGSMIASGIFGVDTRQSLSFQVFSFTSALLVLSLAAIFTFRGKFRIRRRLPEYASVGKKVSYRVYVDNLGGKLQKDLVLYDELDFTFPGYQEFLTANDPGDKNRNWFDRIVGYPRMLGLIQYKRGATISPVEIGELPGNDRNELTLELLPNRRGYIHFNRSRIARVDPLGLIRSIKTRPNEDSLLVLPKTYDMPPVNLKGKRKYQQGGMNLASAVGDSQEFMSLRDYIPGDPMRAIHWRSFAKTGHPVVKEFQDEFFERQGLLLDTFIEEQSREVFEEAVSLAASFIVSVRQQDSLLDLMFVGAESYRFTSGRGLSQIENILEILACVEPCRDPLFSRLDELIMQHTNETSGLICIFLDWDEKRKSLVQKITRHKIPVMVFLLTDKGKSQDLESAPLGEYADNFHVLHIQDIQKQLEQLTTENKL